MYMNGEFKLSKKNRESTEYVGLTSYPVSGSYRLVFVWSSSLQLRLDGEVLVMFHTVPVVSGSSN
jgi:hypothetical protein